MSIPYNIVRDFDKAQGTTHPTDLAYQIRRDINIRYITIQNSSIRPIGIAITSYVDGPVPNILFTLAGGEIKHLGINSHGGPAQFVWILDLNSKKPVGRPEIIRNNAQDFILRDGLNKWFIQAFKRASYSAAF